MKKRLLILVCLMVVAATCLVACGTENNYKGKTKVEFVLEGGVYRNCKLPVVHYYDLKEGQTTFIGEMTAVSQGGDFAKTGYVFEGWYKTKNADGTYSDKWDFSTDKIDANGVTLYANWEKAVKHTYNVCYLDDNNQKVVLGTYNVKQGATFNDVQSYASMRSGYSAIDYVDQDGNLWDKNFTHPGGESDMAIDVYVTYVQGEYFVIKQASDFEEYADNIFAPRNIYLARDVDMQGASLSLPNFCYVFEGNNHTISNFTLAYSDSKNDLQPDPNSGSDQGNSLYVSIFGTLQNATIQNVTFTGCQVVVNTSNNMVKSIFVAPIAVTATESTLTNVSVSFEYKTDALPSQFETENYFVTTDQVVYQQTDCTFTNCVVTASQIQ